MSTRERLLTSAERLTDQFGVNGFGLDLVLQEVGVSKTTFYKYFDSKDELSRVLVEQCAEEMVQRMEATLASRCGDDPVRQLRDLLPVWRLTLRDKQWHGCLFAKYCHAFPDTDEPLAKSSRLFANALREKIAQLANRIKMVRVDAFTHQIMVVLMGYNTYGYVFGSSDDDAEVLPVQLINRIIDRHLPDNPALPTAGN